MAATSAKGKFSSNLVMVRGTKSTIFIQLIVETLQERQDLIHFISYIYRTHISIWANSPVLCHNKM